MARTSYRIGTLTEIKKTLQKVLNDRVNGKLDNTTASFILRTIDVQLKVIDSDIDELLDQMEKELDQYKKSGGY
mgnify:CR=1 FL=1